MPPGRTGRGEQVVVTEVAHEHPHLLAAKVLLGSGLLTTTERDGGNVVPALGCAMGSSELPCSKSGHVERPCGRATWRSREEN